MRHLNILFLVLLVSVAIACTDTTPEPPVIAFDRLANYVGNSGPVELLAVGSDETTYVHGDNIQDVIEAYGGTRQLLQNTEWSHYVVALPLDEARDIVRTILSADDSATTDSANATMTVTRKDAKGIRPRLTTKPRMNRIRRLRGNVVFRIALGVSVSRLSSDVPPYFDLLLCTDQSLYDDHLEHHCLFVLRRNET